MLSIFLICLQNSFVTHDMRRVERDLALVQKSEDVM
jgi:hypothetical protein